MSIATDYARPVLVNGYSCKNCTDVDNAKKNIDPEQANKSPAAAARGEQAVSFGGSLSALNAAQGPAEVGAPSAKPQGARVDVCC